MGDLLFQDISALLAADVGGSGALPQQPSVDPPEGAILRTRLKHLQAEHQTLRESYAEALAAAIEQREQRLREQQQYTARLQQLHRQNELILNCAGDGIVGLDAAGRAIFVNPAAAQMLEYQAEDLLGKPLHQMVHHSRPDGTAYPPEQCPICFPSHCGQRSTSGEDMFWRKGGQCFPIEFTRAAIVQEGEQSAAVVTFRDITQRRLLEMRLRQAQKLESIGQLAAGIAHEINTPTQYIGDNIRFLKDVFEDLSPVLAVCREAHEALQHGQSPAELLQRAATVFASLDVDYLSREIPLAIQQSLEGLERVARIVRSMKEFSHPGGEEKQAIDLNRAIESTLTVSRNEWKYVADVETDLDPNLPPVWCLPGDINQVLLNLIVNAAHAIAEKNGNDRSQKGKIAISTRHDQQWVEIRISDTGVGIPPHIRDKVYDPFFTTKPVGRGTGQGLAIAHAVVTERHGGTIDFESQVGHGTTFIVRLPLGKKTPGGETK